jgi:hypothetical protein
MKLHVQNPSPVREDGLLYYTKFSTSTTDPI